MRTHDTLLQGNEGYFFKSTKVWTLEGNPAFEIRSLEIEKSKSVFTWG